MRKDSFIVSVFDLAQKDRGRAPPEGGAPPQGTATLPQGEARFHAFFDNAAVGMAYADTETGRLVDVNAALGRITGYPAGELLEKTFRDLAHPDERSADWAHLEGHARLESPHCQIERRLRRKDGATIWVRLNTSVVRDAQARPVHIAAVVEDITAERQAQAALLRSEERLRLAVQAANAFTWEIHATTYDIAFSPNAPDVVGFSLPLNGDTFSFVHPEDQHLVMTGLDQALRGAKPLHVEHRIVSPLDGTVSWIRSEGHLLPDATGARTRFLGITQNITERKRRELGAALLAEIQHDLASCTSAQEIMRVVGEKLGRHLDASGVTFAEVDAAADELTSVHVEREGIRPGTHRLSTLLSEEQIRELESGQPSAVADVTARPRGRDAAAAHRAHGIRALLIAPFRSDGRWKFMLAAQRRTPREWRADEIDLVREVAARTYSRLERARAEEALRLSEERLRKSVEVAEAANHMKDEFLAVLSHELRTPLSAILMWARMLDDGLAARPAMLHEGLYAIKASAEAQKKLIEDLLDVSRIIAGKLQLQRHAVAIGALVAEAVSAVQPDADAKGVTVSAHVEEDVGVVRADPVRLKQILCNILTNAVKFTSMGGRVEIHLERRGSGVELRVTDTGCGIAADFLPHVFDRFRQADASHTRLQGGLGLGLAIAKQLVELHGGTIRAESPGPDLGATFIVELPLAKLRAETKAKVEKKRKAKDLTGLNVLLVEDDRETRRAIVTLLRQNGIQVVSTDSAAAAFKAFEKARPDIILSDVGLPGEDGHSLLRRLRERESAAGDKPVPAIALSAFVREQDRRRALEAGFQRHVAKPVEPEQLLAALRTVA